MGGIGQWLVFRAADRSLSLFSLVVPPGAMTPVRDHLAWGLVGIYRGNQDEEFYRLVAGHGLELVRKRQLDRGDFYALFPPFHDVHRVRTTSKETSVSIHLLANDTGCVWPHTYDEQIGEARPFRSGYVNVTCVKGDSADLRGGAPASSAPGCQHDEARGAPRVPVCFGSPASARRAAWAATRCFLAASCFDVAQPGSPAPDVSRPRSELSTLTQSARLSSCADSSQT